MPDSTPPLQDLLVVDLTRVLSGPYCTMLLADMGARVIKIEQPGRGDDTRAWGPPWHGDVSTYYLTINRNKRSVALDLSDEEDRALARELALRADVLVESFRPGLMAGWGLDGGTLRAAGNAGLVSCSVTAFGTGEAGRALPGYDFLLQAMGGLMHVTGEPDGPPLKVGAAVVDLICGLLAANGIQAALLERARTGRGRHVEVSLMDSVLTSLLNQASAWVAGGVAATRRGNRHPSIVPYETFEAADRPIAIAVGAVGIVGIGVGAFFGLSASSTWKDAKGGCTDFPYSCSDGSLDKQESASTKATVSTIAFIAGGAALAVGTVLWFTAGSSKQTAIGIGPGTVTARGSF